MKKILLVAVISATALTFLNSCKKENKQSHLLKMEITDLSSQTSISVKIENQNNEQIFEINDVYGDNTYLINNVRPGDVLKVRTTSNRSSNSQGQGTGSLTFYYSDKLFALWGGDLGYTTGTVRELEVPSNY